MNPSRRRALGAHAGQLAVAILGGWVFHRLGVPAAWLSGSVVAVTLWGALGLGRSMPRAAVDAAMLVSGASMGAGVTPQALAAVGRYPLSLAILALSVVAVTAASMLWLTRVSGWRREDALLASSPGALTTVLAVAVARNAAVAPIAIVQSSRLFILILLLPSAVVFLGGAGTRPIGEGLPIATPWGLLLALFGGLALGHLFERLGVAAPILLGAMVVSMMLHATDWAPGLVPPELATAGLVLIGVFIAERFRTLDAAMLRRLAPAAVGSFLTGMAVGTAFAAAAALLSGVGFADALVAFAPGGLEVMMVLALSLGLDPLYIAIHHLARFLGIGVALPFVFSWVSRRGGGR